ncbi:MAG: monovalent cation/H(+) antiporter subunit G [Clostridia bacterium]|nr:monovalent cation/H(+) antiporter subunit G [Clostridia bacterium]
MTEWIRFGIVCALVVTALIALSVSIMGVFRFKFALNRIHSASMVDTLALLCFAAALIIAKGFSPVSLKIILVIAFQWCTSPIASHMLAKFEYKTDKNLSDHCKIDRIGRD